jgi:hypothetical protein
MRCNLAERRKEIDRRSRRTDKRKWGTETVQGTDSRENGTRLIYSKIIHVFVSLWAMLVAWSVRGRNVEWLMNEE